MTEKKKEQNLFFSNLKKFLSSSIVIKYSDGSQKTHVFDISNLQTIKNVETNRLIDKQFSNYKSGYSLMGDITTLGFSTMRADLYRNYDIMEQDPIIAAVLDVVSEEGSMPNEFGEVIAVKSEKEYIQKTLENLLYDILNIEFNLPWWIRSLAKYGDFFMKLDIVESVGVTNCIPLSVYGVERLEDFSNPALVKFSYDDSLAANLVSYSNTMMNQHKATFEQYEVAHFRLLADSNYLPYGKSYLEGARKIWNQLTLMIDSMMLQRVMRAPERRVFKIDVGNIASDQVPAHMEKIIAKLKKVPYIDERTGDLNLKFNLLNSLEDFYLPVRGDKSGTEITTLPGMVPPPVTDLEFLEQRLYTALKVPKSYLANEEDVNSRATVSAQDLRFARTIDRFHKLIVSELTKVCIVHLYAQGYRDEDLIDFELEMFSPSTVYQLQKIELLDKKTDLASKMKETKLFSDKWIYNNIYNLSDVEADEEEEGIIYDLKKAFRHSKIEEGSDPASEENMKLSASDYGGSTSSGGSSGGSDFEDIGAPEAEEAEAEGEETATEETPAEETETAPEEGGEEREGKTPDSSIDLAMQDQEEDEEDDDLEAEAERERLKYRNKDKKTAKSVSYISRVSKPHTSSSNQSKAPAVNPMHTGYNPSRIMRREEMFPIRKKLLKEYNDHGTFMDEDNLTEV